MSVDQRVQQHYTHGSLLTAVDESLRALGKDPARLQAGDLAQVDELHIGGHEATVGFISACGFTSSMRILDVGSGLGGPAAPLRSRPARTSRASTSRQSSSPSRRLCPSA